MSRGLAWLLLAAAVIVVVSVGASAVVVWLWQSPVSVADHLTAAGVAAALAAFVVADVGAVVAVAAYSQLSWEDVDFESRRLHVRDGLQRIAGELRLVEPKTRQSRRTIALPMDRALGGRSLDR